MFSKPTRFKQRRTRGRRSIRGQVVGGLQIGIQVRNSKSRNKVFWWEQRGECRTQILEMELTGMFGRVDRMWCLDVKREGEVGV